MGIRGIVAAAGHGDILVNLIDTPCICTKDVCSSQNGPILNIVSVGYHLTLIHL